MKIVAIDYGTKRVGLAATDDLQMIALPLQTVASAELMLFLKNYVAQEQVSKFVVGLPLQTSGEFSQSYSGVKAFVAQLQKVFQHIPIEMHDERYTSKMASAAIAQSSLSKQKRRSKALIDGVAAVILLQSYLEQQNYLKG